MNHGQGMHPPKRYNKSQCDTVPGLCDQVVTTCTSGRDPDSETLQSESATTVPQCPYVIGSGDANTTGDSVCKTGPPLPMSVSLKNVLIVGDSVSDGYTPFVSAQLAQVALVQHSPWGMVDGGAEETLYGARCIENLLRAPDGTPLSPQVLMFNWGLHNSLGGNCTPPCVPGQLGPPAEYAPNLELIVQYIKSAPALAQTKLLFAITSPDLCNEAIDTLQVGLNKQAAAIMQKHGIPIVDLYAAITQKCGPVPQAECFDSRGCFCPHCPANHGLGYLWLANSTIVPAITRLMTDDDAVATKVTTVDCPDKSDCTKVLQAALFDQDAQDIVVPAGNGAPWAVGPLIINRSHVRLTLQPGVVLYAKQGEFKKPDESLLTIRSETVHDHLQNVTCVLTGATLRMRKMEYLPPNYVKGEWRHTLQILGASDVAIIGGTFLEAGGDGIYVAGNWLTNHSRNILLSGVTTDGAWRNGLSVISAINLTVTGSTFKKYPPSQSLGQHCCTVQMFTLKRL